MGKNPNQYVEFYKYMANLLGCTPATAKKYWMAARETAVHFTHFDGYCILPEICSISMKKVPEQISRYKDKDGNICEETIPAWWNPKIKATEEFINDSNGRGVTIGYRFRVRTKTLTSRDIERMNKEELNRQVANYMNKQSEERKEQGRQEFLEFLKDKKKDYKEKKRKEMDEQSIEDTTSD